MSRHMRIVGGSLKGRRIFAPPAGTLNTRPMLERVRESLFNILSHMQVLEGARVLDLCAGTGSLGLESLSRGAKHVHFVEKTRRNAKLIEKSIESMDLADKTEVLLLTLPACLERMRQGPFDLILFDPPFPAKFVQEVVDQLHQKHLLAEGGLIVVEREIRSGTLGGKGLTAIRKQSIGDVNLWLLQREEA